MKTDMEAMKEQMTMMMEEMMNMRKMMEDNTTIVVVASTTIEMDPIHSVGFNQVNHPVLDVVGQGGEAAKNAYGPHHVQIQSKHSFLPYGLPPNYTPPIVVYAYGENISNYAPVLIENQQPQFDHAYVSQPMRETHEVPQDHTLAGFGVYPGYTTEGQTFSSIPVLNAPGISQCRPLSQSLHFVRGEGPSTVLEKERIEHMKERLRAIEGGGNYAFADIAELCLIPDVVIPPKFKVPDFDKYKGTTCPKNHLKMYCRKMVAYVKDEKLFMHFF